MVERKMEIRDGDLGVIYIGIVFKVMDINKIKNRGWGSYPRREPFRDR